MIKLKCLTFKLHEYQLTYLEPYFQMTIESLGCSLQMNLKNFIRSFLNIWFILKL